MKNIIPFIAGRCTALLVFLHSTQALLGADVGPAKQIVNPYGQTESTLRSLEENKQKQIQAAQTLKAFHAFTFTDRWEESGIRFEHRPVDDGAKDYKAVHYDHGNGLAAADVDADGRFDLYFVNQFGASQLWRNLGRGKFEDITATAGVALANKVCVAASFADIDNDGLPDLFVTTVRMGNVLFKNLGGGKFKDITAESGITVKRAAHSSGAIFFDFNKDGLLDLFVANVGVYTRNEKGRGGFYLGRSDAFQGWQFPARSEQSILYQNLGGGKFEDVSRKMALEHSGWSGDATFCDLNQDGYPDLYVPSMSGDDKYYENDRGQRFLEKTAAYFPKTPWGAMGVKFFDYNLDGLMDLYVTDMHSDMTSRQIKAGDQDFSPRFEKQKSDVWCSVEWSPAALQGATNNILGNAFYQNQGQGKFVEVSAKVGAETYWPWGVSVADLNADGYEDIFVTAGMGYPLRYAINSLLLNESGQRFVDSEFVLGVEPRQGNRIEKEFFTLDCSGSDKRHPLCRGKSGTLTVIGTTSSRSSVAIDLDDDGDLDLVTNEWNDRPQVLVSNLSEKKPIHYLKLKLVGTVSNRDGLGAMVKVQCGPKTYTRFHDGKSGYLSQSSMPLYFGLDAATKIDRIEVLWASGKKQLLTEKILVDVPLTITEEP
jgi:enediyne biosynthesis protein E4